MTKSSLRLFPLVSRLLPAVTLIILSAPSLWADTVIVESRTGTAVTGNPPYLEGPGNWANSSAKSAAPGTTSTRGGCRYETVLTGPPSFTITPTLGTAGGHYFVEVSHASGGNASSIIADLVMSIATVGGSGLPATTDGFKRDNGQSVWYRIGTIDLDPGVNNPAITFTYSSGTAVTPAVRIVADAFRFVNTNDLCLSGLPQLSTVNGPLAAGQTFVIVPAVNAAATNVSVFADGIKIGELNSGVVAGVNTVPTTALVQNQDITATQRSANNIDSCPSTIGPNVGGGANPQIRVALSIRDNNPTGPIGSNGGTTGSHFVYMKATGTVAGGFGNAPAGGSGNVLTPSTCWQTLTFDRATDDLFGWAGPYGDNTLPNDLASLDSIAFAIDDVNNTGPFVIYIDNIVNGTTVIQDFETSTAGDVASTITQPSLAGSTSAFLLSPAPGTISPNISTIVNTNADSGTNCLVLSWQFKDVAAANWLRATFQGTAGTGAKPNPIVDLTKPISIRFLVLPVGTATNNLTTSVMTNVTVYLSQNATFSVTASGAGPFNYQWQHNGTDITGETTPSFTTNNVAATAAGTYAVVVNNATCYATNSAQLIVLDPLPTITSQPVAKTIKHIGETATFTVAASAPVAAGLPLTYQWSFNGTDITDATALSLSTNNVQIADAGYYTVVVGNTYGSVTSAVATLDVVQPGVIVGTGTGLRGNYYSPAYSTNPFAGPIVLSRIDPTVDFNWGQGATGRPDPSIAADYFTVRWSGQVQALDTDTYTFYVKSDDGQRLWVNGQQLVNDWILHGATEVSGTIALAANQQYDIVMEYFEGAVVASAQLSWSAAGGGVVKEIIPMSQLYPAAAAPVSPALNFNVSDGTNLVFNWGPGTYTLVWATNVTGPYTNRIDGVTSPHTNLIGSEPQKFFRLQVLQ